MACSEHGNLTRKSMGTAYIIDNIMGYIYIYVYVYTNKWVSKYQIIYSYVCWFIVEPMKTSSILPDNTQQFLEFSQPTDSLGHHNAVPLRLGLGFEPHPNAWAVCTANVPPRRWDCGLVQRV
jgi:hypothetical protein